MTLLTRRSALAALAAAALAPPARAADPVTLTVARRTIEVGGRAASVFGITQPDGTHGLTATVGTPFRVRLLNRSGEPTLIHWHGLTPPWRQDGVPDISGPAIADGGAAEYDFPLKVPGTYWMHSHQGLQEQSLMTAPLIVREASPRRDEQEVVVLLHDFSFRPPEEILSGLRRGAPMAGMGMAGGMAGHGGPAGHPAMPPMAGMGGPPDLNDVTYDALLANDRTLADPQVVPVERGGRVRLRIINGASASNFVVSTGAREAALVAVDGQDLARPVPGTTFPVAMAQRIDLVLTLPRGASATPVLAVLEGTRRRTGIVLATPRAAVPRLAAEAARPTPALGLALEAQLRARNPLPRARTDRALRVELTGDMARYVWGLNGRSWPDAPRLEVAEGERVELLMTNRTMMSHPMHLHGHSFQVVAIGGRRLEGAVRDTVLVPPMQSVRVAFQADNPGRWAFHCHNLYHMEAGMFTTVDYRGIGG